MKKFFVFLLAINISIFSLSAAARTMRVNVQGAFPGSLAHLGQLPKDLIEKINTASDGSIKMRFQEPGALVPAGEMFDAISKGSVDAGWASAGLWSGKNSAFNLFAAVPFGPEAPEYLAWYYYGGGQQLHQSLYAKYNIYAIPCGLSSPEASGWFKKEIKKIEDFKGLKMRFYGLGAKVMERLGVSTQLLGGGEVFQALQLGTIDATEFGMPNIDYSFGFHQVAKHYYLPGWHQPATFQEFMINKKKWDKFSEAQKMLVEIACGDNVRQGLAMGEAAQFKALQDIQAKGVTLHRWDDAILKRLEQEWSAVVAEEKKANPYFAKTWDSLSAFRQNYSEWESLGFVN